MWLPVDGFMWTETCWSSFYNFNYFNNLRILQFMCISWKIKCLILLMHGAIMKLKFIYCMFLFFKKSVNMPYFRLPPRCKWDLMGCWLVDTYVSEKPIIPIFKGQDGTRNLSRKVGSYPSTLRNMPEERKVSVLISYYTGSSDSAIVIDKLARIRKEVLVANSELLNQNVTGQNEEN